MSVRTSRNLSRLLLVVVLSTTGSALWAQEFSCGSTDADGAIDVTEGTVTLDLPPDGIFHATTITVADGATLTFNPNALNTPVFLLASGDVTIDGTIAVNGSRGTSSPPVPGKAGPGGFDGGAPAIGGLPPGAGQGPGAGLGGVTSCCDDNSAGAGSYRSRPVRVKATDGQTYGSPTLIPLVGGSGGGGATGGFPGGGGGGAILICSDSSVLVRGTVEATGGDGSGTQSSFNRGLTNGGSGGAIRIVAPLVLGTGSLDVRGGCDGADVCFNTVSAGPGRVRIDAVDRSQLNLMVLPSHALSVGSTMLAFLDPQPRLDLVEVAGRVIPEGTQDPVEIFLPAGSPTTQTIRVQATDFTGTVPIEVVLTPENGDPIIVPAEIDMGGGSTAEVTVTVDFPLNVVTHVDAWTQ